MPFNNIFLDKKKIKFSYPVELIKIFKNFICAYDLMYYFIKYFVNKIFRKSMKNKIIGYLEF